MLKITKITDYALVVLCCMVKNQAEGHNNILSTAEIAKLVNLQAPTVSKILKILVKSGLVQSYRGIDGGYCLAKDPKDISVSRVIECLEGPIAVTECAKITSQNKNLNQDTDITNCEFINNCQLNQPWQKINLAVNNMLNKISIYNIAYNNIDL